MYSTVITKHPTSVVHPPKPIGKPMITNAASAELFTNAAPLKPGQISLPTKLADLDLSDPSFRNLEKPVFLHKGEKASTKHKSKTNNVVLDPIANKKLGNEVVKESNDDAKKVKERLKNLRAEEKTKIVKGCKFFY